MNMHLMQITDKNFTYINIFDIIKAFLAFYTFTYSFCVRQKTIFRSQLSPSIMYVLQIEFRSSDLVVSVLTHWPRSIFFHLENMIQMINDNILVYLHICFSKVISSVHSNVNVKRFRETFIYLRMKFI